MMPILKSTGARVAVDAAGAPVHAVRQEVTAAVIAIALDH
jgi:hypothetical protein